MAPVDNSALQWLRGFHALEVLDRLATHVKFDRDFTEGGYDVAHPRQRWRC